MPEIDFDPIRLSEPGERLPAIKDWLTGSVWSTERYASESLADYLAEGEHAVCHLEESISTGALSVWDELEAESRRAPTLRAWLGIEAPRPLTEPRAAVVFDGLSIREMPLLLKLAEATGIRVRSTLVVGTCLPTDTTAYVEQRVIGKPIGPSRMKGRAELAERNIEAFYLEQPNSREAFPSDRSLLIWSSYPDRLFFNDEARDDRLFSTFHRDQIPVIWKCALQAIPRKLPVLVTADHGYIYFGAGLESTRSTSGAPAALEQARFRQFPGDVPMPAWHPDLQILPQTRLAMMRGRLRAHPQGPSSRKLYQHGGFSLMEVLVPWIELEKD